MFLGLTSSAEYKSLLKTTNGDIHYIDFENLKKIESMFFPRV